MDTIDYRHLYDATVPSVVSVYREAGQRGAGSGFVYDDAHVLTNEHVVRECEAVDVRFHDGTWQTGTVVGSDVYTDLAVVRIEDRPPDADPLPIATGADAPRPGQAVAALGNPLGLEGSITAGVVSGVDRSMPISGGFAIPDVVQTDAPINPGNSGGPLVAADADGDSGSESYPVVGVNRARSGDNIGFAVSARVVSTVVPALVSDGRYRHSYLRISTLDVTPRVASANGLDEPRGVVVVDIRDQSPGESLRACSGSKRVDGTEVPVGGDVVVGLDGVPVRSHEELTRRLLTDTEPGEPVALDVIRDGAELTVEFVAAERPAASDDRRRAADRSSAVPIE
ncbi:trypsin-like peptidase domain-containing protein [Halomicroarcula limicola]|uniref:Trypsin-like peptidase domain-containing protein n=1 Tax=Haloarcula limicola TaxID=1429915 RepID=A0A8J8C614_9EURY|nr:trypsin-like peptidase domain-containing protein [Halomicroarcula limicola]MBV0925799.1 trypsin-like peptidase domain-containing protein [Halomicroarcula limicola]